MTAVLFEKGVVHFLDKRDASQWEGFKKLGKMTGSEMHAQKVSVSREAVGFVEGSEGITRLQGVLKTRA